MTRLRNDLNAAMTEKELLAGVRALAELFKWRVYHTHNSRRSPAGFPDLVLSRPPYLLFCELKREGGKLSPAQRDWLRDIDRVSEATGGLVSGYCWFPRDADEIERVLRDGR